jgi:hypothetical protein
MSTAVTYAKHGWGGVNLLGIHFYLQQALINRTMATYTSFSSLIPFSAILLHIKDDKKNIMLCRTLCYSFRDRALP